MSETIISETSRKRKASQKKYRQSEKGKASKKRYVQSEKGKATNLKAVKKYQKTEKGKASCRMIKEQSHTQHPEIHNARNAVKYAIASGKLPRPNTRLCYYCPKPAQQYHHWHGYEKEYWLDVVPICKECHNRLKLV